MPTATANCNTLLSRACARLQAPCVVSLISDTHTPVSVFNTLSHSANKLGFLLESAEGDARLARYSFVGVDPLLTLSFADGTVTVVDTETGEQASERFENPCVLLQAATAMLNPETIGMSLLPGVPFTGGLVGYMGYGATQHFENIAQQAETAVEIPDGFYGLYDSLVIFDHQFRRLHILSRRGESYAKALQARIEKTAPLKTLPAGSLDLERDVWADVSTRLSKSQFLSLVSQCKDCICEGQVFQIVLSHRFSLAAAADALDIYRVLQAINPSPYAYFLKLPGFNYIGSSPETFVRCQDGQVLLRAIAGTRPRGKSPAEDEALACELKKNEKELAEHRMLVDLGRNDLGRVCVAGTVKVGEIAVLTRYTHVMHLATEVTGKLAAGKTCFDAFRGCFPRGTVSGAPKVRAMQLLAQLEPERRGIYSGVVGYFDFKGNMDGAIAIRSALVKDGLAHVNAGAGIVMDSDPEAEYEETRNKAKSIIKAVVAANSLSGGAQ